MITVPTTLVLGAGASKPYGFPTGSELSEIILENLTSSNSQWFEALKANNVDESVASRFAAQLMRSGRETIDSFLASHGDLIAVGKICIALAIIPFEEVDRLYKFGWYKYLWNKMATPAPITSPGKITIITFNYDRSLDQFIYDAISNTYSNQLENSEVNIDQLLDCVPIHHVHGQLGKLPCQENPSRRYFPDLTQGSLEIAWRQIRIPSERYENRPLDTIINYTLRQSERIYFLGFGYDNDNLEKLGINNLKDKTMKGTSYNLTNMERGEITSKWGIELPKENCEILSFLRNHAPLD